MMVGCYGQRRSWDALLWLHHQHFNIQYIINCEQWEAEQIQEVRSSVTKPSQENLYKKVNLGRNPGLKNITDELELNSNGVSRTDFNEQHISKHILTKITSTSN